MSNPEIIFWGATGQAKVLRELVQESFELKAVFDNSLEVPPPFTDVPLVRAWSGFTEWLAARSAVPAFFLVAIGGDRGAARVEMQGRLECAGLSAATVAHRTAFVAHNANIGAGSQILAKAAVCVEVELGKACIVNTCASVDHECRLGEGVHVAPGAHLAGAVEVGDFTMIGAGATVLPRVKIGRNCVVGAGSVVTRDLPDGAVAYGNPARVIRYAGGHPTPPA